MTPNKLRDYYTILGIDKNSTQSDIKIAYRNLSKKWHPDISKESNAIEFFPIIVESYTILSDISKKSIYDKQSKYGKDYVSINELHDFEFSNSNYEYEILKDELDKHKKEMIDILLVIDNFVDNVVYTRLVHCNNCDGSGYDKDKLLECIICHGDGETTNGKKCIMCTGKGHIETEDCDACYGIGNINGDSCSLCKGSGKLQLSKCNKCENGRVTKKETINLNIDQFVDNKLKIDYMGNSSTYNVGKIGNLFIKIKER